MSKRQHRSDDVRKLVLEYIQPRSLDFNQYSHGVQISIIDPSYARIDIWPSTGKYHIVETNYSKLGQTIDERIDERGTLPVGETNIINFLDRVIYGSEVDDV